VDELDVQAWLDAYGRAARSNDPAEVGALFSEDAVYRVGPFADPWRGRDRIVAEWTADPEGQTDLAFRAEPLLGSGDRWVAHWSMTFVTRASPGSITELDGLLVLRFDGTGRCSEHLEWYHRRTLPGDR
jgi:ketosteroid isomerase-like protein